MASALSVIPAEAGIQIFKYLDFRFRGSDNPFSPPANALIAAQKIAAEPAWEERGTV